MSVKVSSRVWEHAKQNGTPLVILLALADFADDDGIAFPSVPILAQKARISERHALRILEQLDTERAIIYIPGNGRGNRSHYLVLVGLTRNDLHTIAAKRADDELFIPFQERVTLLTKRVTCTPEKGDMLGTERVTSPAKRVTCTPEKGDMLGTERVTCLHRSEDHFGALPSAESTISPVMIHHEIRHEDPSGDPPPPPTPIEPSDAESRGGGGGGDSPTAGRVADTHPSNAVDADGTYPESRRLLYEAGAQSTRRVQQAARLPPDLVRAVLAQGATIGRSLITCSDAADNPELQAALATPALQEPRYDRHNRTRYPVAAQHHAPDDPQRSEPTDAEYDELLAIEHAVIAERLAQQQQRSGGRPGMPRVSRGGLAGV